MIKSNEKKVERKNTRRKLALDNLAGVSFSARCLLSGMAKSCWLPHKKHIKANFTNYISTHLTNDKKTAQKLSNLLDEFKAKASNNKYFNRKVNDLINILAKLIYIKDELKHWEATEVEIKALIDELVHIILVRNQDLYAYKAGGSKYDGSFYQVPVNVSNYKDLLLYYLGGGEIIHPNSANQRPYVAFDLDIGKSPAEFRAIKKVITNLSKIGLAPSFVVETSKKGFHIYYKVDFSSLSTPLANVNNLFQSYGISAVSKLLNLFCDKKDGEALYKDFSEKVEAGRVRPDVKFAYELLEDIRKADIIHLPYQMWYYTDKEKARAKAALKYLNVLKKDVKVTPEGIAYSLFTAVVISAWESELQAINPKYEIDENAIEFVNSTTSAFRNPFRNPIHHYTGKVYDLKDYSDVKKLPTYGHLEYWLNKFVPNLENASEKIAQNISKKTEKTAQKLSNFHFKTATKTEMSLVKKMFNRKTKLGANYYETAIKPTYELLGVTSKETRAFIDESLTNFFVNNTPDVPFINYKAESSQGRKSLLIYLGHIYVSGSILISHRFREYGQARKAKTLKNAISMLAILVNQQFANPLTEKEIADVVNDIYNFFANKYKSKFSDKDYQVFMRANAKRRFKAISAVANNLFLLIQNKEIKNKKQIEMELKRIFGITKKENFREVFGVSFQTYYKWLQTGVLDILVNHMAYKILIFKQLMEERDVEISEIREFIDNLLKDELFIKLLALSITTRFHFSQKVSLETLMVYMKTQQLQI